MTGSAHEIGSRFQDEQEHIERYVRLLLAKSTLHDRQVHDLNLILKRAQIDQLPMRQYDRTGAAYTPNELAELVRAIRRTEPEVYQTILGHEQGLEVIPSFGCDGPAAQYVDRPMDEWINYFLGQLSSDAEEDDTEGMLRYALREAERGEEEHDEEERIPTEALKALLSTALDHAQHVRLRQRVDAMVYAREQFEEIEVLARISDQACRRRVGRRRGGRLRRRARRGR